MLYLFGGEHEALGIDAATGAISWRAPLDGRVEYGTTAADGRLFAATSAGTLIALGPERLAASPPASVPPAAPAVGATVLADLSGTPDGLTDPTGLDVDPSGRIWVAEGARDAFAIFAPDGSFIERWAPGPGSSTSTMRTRATRPPTSRSRPMATSTSPTPATSGSSASQPTGRWSARGAGSERGPASSRSRSPSPWMRRAAST
jgi:hypothetical protein